MTEHDQPRTETLDQFKARILRYIAPDSPADRPQVDGVAAWAAILRVGGEGSDV